MTEQELLTSCTRILRDLLADDAIVLSMTTTRGEVPGWDSFAYVTFVVALEIELDVKFRIADIESFKSVGDIVSEAKRLVDGRHAV